MPISLTPVQIEALFIRPVDAVADVYGDTFEIDDTDDFEQLYEEFKSRIVRLRAIPDNLTELESWILADAIDGSTYAVWNSWDDDETNGTMARAIRTMRILSDKVSQAIGYRIDAPEY